MFTLLRRVIVLLILLAVLAGIAIAVAVTVGRPIVEDRVADRLSKELGTDVSVSATGSARDLVRGNLGDVEATAGQVERDGIVIEDVKVVVRDAKVDIGSLRDRQVSVSTSGVAAEGYVTEEALDAYVRAQLADADQKQLRSARVVIEDGAVRVRAGKVAVPVAITVADDGSLVLAPRIAGGPVAQAVGTALAAQLAKPVDVGELPFDARLEKVEVEGGRVHVTGAAPAGTVELTSG